MGEIEKIGELEIEEDFQHHVHMWRVKRVCWTLMALLVVAALAGLLGAGPLSNKRVTGPAETAVEYDRFTRWDSPTHIRITTPKGSEKLELSLPLSFVRSIDVEHIQPEPDETRLDGDKHTWIFQRAGDRSEISIAYRPETFGRMSVQLQIKDAGSIQFEQFALP